MSEDELETFPMVVVQMIGEDFVDMNSELI